MNTFAKIIAASSLIAIAGTANAQSTTQQAVVGVSGDPVYSVQVIGANGVTYNCLPDLIVRDGLTVRQCRRVGAGSGQMSLGAGAGVAAAALVAIAVIAASGT